MHDFSKDADQVQLVSLADEPQATMDKYQAHQYPVQLHRAVSVWLLNDAGSVLLQQRSQQKIVGAGWWANTICGNVRPGESYQECAHRRLEEELGIVSAAIRSQYTFSYAAYGNETYGEREVDQVFAGTYSGELMPNPAEVQATKWVSFEQLRSAAKTITFPKAAATLTFSHEQLVGRTGPQVLSIDGDDLLVAPWTILMLRDDRLQLA